MADVLLLFLSVVITSLSIIAGAYHFLCFEKYDSNKVQAFLRGDRPSNSPIMIGHRGAMLDAPENTLTAFRVAAENGAFGVEFDVDFTKDGHAVIIHDATVDRTTDGQGKVNDYTLENIRKLNALGHFKQRNYSCIVFMANNKFETGKKRLSYLTFADFAYCVEYMIVKWTTTSTDANDADTDLDIDKNFLQDLRDLRTFYTDKDISDEHKSAVFAEIKANDSKELAKTYDSHVKNFDRILINIGAGLIHQKEMKDIFTDLVEKFIEPCKQLNLTVGGLSIFLQALTTTVEKLSSIKKAGLQRLVAVYLRYMTVLHKCIIQMYPAL